VIGAREILRCAWRIRNHKTLRGHHTGFAFHVQQLAFGTTYGSAFANYNCPAALL
jgi:hypothetical protein